MSLNYRSEVTMNRKTSNSDGESTRRNRNKRETERDILKMTNSSTLSMEEWRSIVERKKNLSDYSKDRIKQSFIRGIPSKFRGQLWCIIC